MTRKFLAAVALLCISTFATAADNLTVKDGNAASKVLCKKDVGGVLYECADYETSAAAGADATKAVAVQGVTGGKAVPISDNGGSITVDGTVAATQSGTWNVVNATLEGAIKAEDVASANADPGIVINTKRANTAAASSGTDGDYQPLLTDTNGQLWVNCGAGCSGGTQYAEDAVAASGNTGTVALGVQVASPASTAADGDWTWAQFTGGKLHTIDLSANAALGTTGDSAWTSGSGSAIALLKAIAGAAVDTTTPVPVKTDQTTPGTTDLVHAAGFSGTVTATIQRPADTSAYAAGDVFADSTSAPTSGGFTFTSACRASGGSGIISDAMIMYSTSVAVAGTLYIYDTSITAANDNAAMNVSDTDQAKLVGTIPFLTVAEGSNAVHNVQNLNIGYTCVSSANLRFMVKITTGYTPASGDIITARLKVVQTN